MSNPKVKILFYLYCFWTFSYAGCSSSGQDYKLHTDVTKYARHFLDVKEVIPAGYKIIEMKVKYNLLLLKVVEPLGRCHFMGINLTSHSVSFNVLDPTKDYMSSCFDVEGDVLICLSALKPSHIYKISLKANETDSLIMDTPRSLIPGQIALNNDQLFLYADVYGVGVINLNSLAIDLFRVSGGSGTVSPMSSSISEPINDTLNLLSGHVENDSIRLYAIDRKNSIKWQFGIKEFYNDYKIHFLSLPNRFIVKSDNYIYSLDKNTGREIWRTPAENSIKYLYSWKDKIMECSLYNPNLFIDDKDSIIYNIGLRLIDSQKGIQLWKTTFNSTRVPYFGACNNYVLITTEKEFKVYDISNGREVEKIRFTSNKRNSYAFETLSDIVTGKYYLKSFDDVLYW